VVSGEKAGCDAVVAAADEFGCRAVPLKVAGAFHSDIMRSAADGLRPLLAACRFERPGVRVISNVDATYHEDADRIREWLYRQTFNPVRWQACVERMFADGCGEFWEIGPGRTLTSMMRKINRQAATTNISAAGDLQPAA
jgi:[acyl-carrier-protein] S-malonyltransferase